MSRTYPTRSTTKTNQSVLHTERTYDSILKKEKYFGLCMEKWKDDFPKELCISNVIYVVLMVLRKVNTNEGEKEFSVVVKVGYTGNRMKGTLFDRLEEQFRVNNAVDIIPLMIMQGNKMMDIEIIEKNIHKFLEPKRVKISCIGSKYRGLSISNTRIPKEFYECDEEIIDEVYDYCKFSGLKQKFNSISEKMTIDNYADQSRVKSIYGEHVEFLFLDTTDSLNINQIKEQLQYY